MQNLFVLFLMLFFHIVDDYYLQGILAYMKQKQWWRENAPNPMYQSDYIAALLMHSLSWSFMIMLPIAVTLRFSITPEYIILFILNAIIHGTVDDLKANKKKCRSVNSYDPDRDHRLAVYLRRER